MNSISRKNLLLIIVAVALCIFTLTWVFAAQGDGGSNAITTQRADGGLPLVNESKPILISVATLIALLGLTLKIGMEMQKNATHRDNTNIHTPQSELMAKYRQIKDCDTLHLEVRDIQGHLLEMKEVLGRVDERTKKLE